MDSHQLRDKISELLAGQRLAVLSTSDRGSPYASLIAFSASGNLRAMYFATSRATRKYANLMSEPRVALLIDSRANLRDEFQQAAAVTGLGTAGETGAGEKKRLSSAFLAKHPDLQAFIAEPSTAFFAVRTETFIYVARFREVFEYRLDHKTGSGS